MASKMLAPLQSGKQDAYPTSYAARWLVDDIRAFYR